MTAGTTRRVALLTLIILAFRIATALSVTGPGYTDAYYFANVASRLAHGQGLTADFVWAPLEARELVLPLASHLFWVPLPTILGALGVLALGWLGEFRGAQAAIVAVAALLPLVTFAAARRLGVSEPLALAGAAVAGLGALFAPGLADVDAYAPAAVLGTLFFLAYARAAEGDVRAGATAGLLVGLLFLARSEGALFGLALLALVVAPRGRAAGLAGAAVALAIGGAWLARDLAAGPAPDLFARTALLVRYERFFAIEPPTWDAFAGSLDVVAGAKVAALATNLLTFVLSFAIVLVVPVAAGVVAAWRRPAVRAWLLLLVGVYLAQSLVWTLHSTRGSYFHSLAAFFPFGVAIAAAGAERLLRGRAAAAAAAWTWGAVVLAGALSIAAVAQWHAVFDPPAAARAAAVADIPAGPFLAIDGAAWRWISGRTAVVTPADSVDAAACYASSFGASAIVLEKAHFSAYDALYDEVRVPRWLGAPTVRGDIKIFPITEPLDTLCGMR